MSQMAPATASLIAAARRSLASAKTEAVPGTRYVGAHLAALRAAAALVAESGYSPRRSKPRSVWDLLAAACPDMAEWASYFAAGAGKRAAAEAGLPRAVSASEATELLRDADTFLTLAESALTA